MDEWRFEAEFPIFTIVDHAKFQKDGFSATTRLIDPEIGGYVPLFTDVDLVRSFIESFFAATGKVAVGLKNAKALRAILTDLERNGCHHVGIDISKLPTRIAGRFCTIKQLIEEGLSPQSTEP